MASPKILIADDSHAKIDLIRAMLLHFKWHADPLIAMTSEEAMQMIDEHAITHAFVDFYIPTKNGPSIIRSLKAKHPNAHAALVSSSDKQDNFEEAMKAGAEACICTSWQADEVEKAFGEVLERWKGSEEAKDADDSEELRL